MLCCEKISKGDIKKSAFKNILSKRHSITQRRADPSKSARAAKQALFFSTREKEGNLHEFNLGRHFSFIAISKRENLGLQFHSQVKEEYIF